MEFWWSCDNGVSEVMLAAQRWTTVSMARAQGDGGARQWRQWSSGEGGGNSGGEDQAMNKKAWRVVTMELQRRSFSDVIVIVEFRQ
ncbi:hypothetical protein U1Q18_025124 [Sarracenia purpurea var. burkii]